MSKEGEQFQKGFEIPVAHQDAPGLQSEQKGPSVVNEHLPSEDGGFAEYLAAGKLKGKKAIITGGDSGIGRATAILFAMEGADSLIAYLPVEEKDAQETKKKVEEKGAKCHLVPCDLKKKEDCQKVVDTAIKEMGAINILFNNAAFQKTSKSILELPEDQWEFTFATNIHPFFYMAKYTLPHMKSGDVIVNNASINAYIGRPDLLDYTSTKGAIVSFTRGLANQFVDKGIRVNAIAPGPVWTPLIPSTMHDEAQEEFTSPMGRPSQPSEMAACVVFLSSKDSSALSGQTIHANGGVIVNG